MFFITIVFDPNEIADITNPDYVRIHEEYKNLVGFKKKRINSL